MMAFSLIAINTAKRIQVALEIASNNMGKIRFAVVDGAECLDSETLDLFAKIAKRQEYSTFALCSFR